MTPTKKSSKKSDTVSRELADGTVVEVPTGADGVNPVSVENPVPEANLDAYLESALSYDT